MVRGEGEQLLYKFFLLGLFGREALHSGEGSLETLTDVKNFLPATNLFFIDKVKYANGFCSFYFSLLGNYFGKKQTNKRTENELKIRCM